MTTTSVGIRLAVDGGAKVQSDLARVQGGIDGLGRSAESVSRQLAGLAPALAGAFSAVAFIQAADSVTVLNNQLKLATGSAAAAGQAYSALFDIAQRSRVSFTELGGTFAAIARSSQELGLSQRQLLNVTEAIGNAMTISGGSASSMNAALVQLGQGLSSGTLRGEELNSVMEQTPRLAKALADGLGVGIGELRKLGEQGALTAQAVIEALQSQQQTLASELASSATTVGQAFTQLKNAATAAVGDFDKASGSTGALATGIQSVATSISDLRAAFDGVSASGRDFSAFGDGVSAVIRTVALGATTAVVGLQQLGTVAAGLAASGVALATGNLSGAREAMRAAGEDVNRLGAGWQKQADAILNSAGAAKRASETAAEAANEIDRLAKKGTAAAGSQAAAMLVAQKEGRAYADLMGKMATDKEKFTAAVFDAKAALGSLYSPEIEARLRAHYIKPEKEAKDKADEFAKALESVQEKSSGLNTNYTETLSALYGGYQKGRIGAEDYAKAVEGLIKQQPFYRDGLKEVADAEKALAAIEADLAKTELARIDAAEKSAASAAQKVQSLLDEEKALAIAAAQNISLAQALQDVAIARLQERQAAVLRDGDPLSRDSEALAIQAEIDALRRLKDALGRKEGREAATKAADDAKKAWERTADQIENSLTDALMRGFESGKDFAKNLRDTVVNMFKTLVLRPIVSAVVNPVAGAITGGLGLAGNANAATGGIGNITNLFSGGSDMLGSIGSAVFGNSAAYGAALGTTSFGAGSQAAMLAAQTGEFGLAGLTATSGAAGGAMASGAALQWIGGALAIASLLKGFDDSGTIHTGGLAQYSAAGGTQTSTQHGAFGMGFGGVDYGKAGTELASGMAKTIVGMLDTTATTFGKAAGYTAATAFADDTSKDGAWGGLLIKNAAGQTSVNWDDTRTSRWAPREFADGEAGAKEYAAAVAKDVRDLLVAQTPDWADTMLNALGDAPTLEQLAGTVAQINEVAAALKFMGMASESFAGMAESATSALLAAMGGAQAATAKLGGYYQNFYTESERTGLATKALKDEMAAFGKEMPGTRAAFRGLVDAAIAGGDPALAANLLNVADKFAAIVPAAAETAKKIADERLSLEKQWLQVTGNTSALREIEILEIDASNQALQRQIWAYEDQQAAQEAATSAIEAATKAYAESQASAAAAYAESQQKILDSWADAESFLSGLTRNIRSYLDNLNAEAAGVQGYENAAAAFSAQMTLARGGDRDALSGVTSYASTLLDAINRESATADEARLRAGRVRGQLAGLPAQIKPEQLIVNAINASTQALLSGYNTAIYGVVTSLGQGFDRLDTNLSRGIDFSEFTLAMAGKATDAELQRLFALIDTDNDNIISKAEAQTAATNTIGQQIKASLAGDFAMLDTSLNGALDMTEFTSAFQGLATDEMLKAIFNELDVNGDGQISKLEAIKASSGETAINTYGLDKLTRIKEMVDSLKWGTADWDQISTQAMATVAKQQGWTASDISQAIGRFSGQEIADFFSKYGQNINVGGLTSASQGSTSSSASLTSGVKSVPGGFTIGGGATASAVVATSPSTLGNTYYGSLGTAIYDPAAVARLDSINSYVNSLDWSQQGVSALETYQAAQQYGVTQSELAIATGYSLADINALFDSAGIPRFASGGMHSGGLRLVGEDGPELEVTGPSRIYNAADTARMLSSRVDDAAFAEMVAEVRALREDNRAQASALVQANIRMAKLMERWENNGMPETRVTA